MTPEFFKVIVRNHLWFISVPNIHSYSERLYCLRAGTISWTLPGPNLWQVINVSWMKGLLVQHLAQTWSSGHVYLWKGGCLLDYAFLQSRCWGRRRWVQGCWEVTPGTDQRMRQGWAEGEMARLTGQKWPGSRMAPLLSQGLRAEQKSKPWARTLMWILKEL